MAEVLFDYREKSEADGLATQFLSGLIISSLGLPLYWGIEPS